MFLDANKLESWSSPPSDSEREKIIRAHESVRAALGEYLPVEQIKATYNLAKYEYETYLQGSYANGTNIRLNSDVDVVVQLKSIWGQDISQLDELQKSLINSAYSDSEYTFDQYKKDIYDVLVKYFGADQVVWKAKCIYVKGTETRSPTDVVPGFSYKKFKWFIHASEEGHDFVEGLKLWNTESNTPIINYPKLHKENMSLKHRVTNEKFKGIVRVFKNIKVKLVENDIIGEKDAPSYFIENLLYNTTDTCYQGNLLRTFLNVMQQLLEDLNRGRIVGYRCANEQDSLISETTWNITDATSFIVEASKYALEGLPDENNR